MRILISCLSFRSYTGSELYVFELARELAKEHDVHILSHLGGELVSKVESFGVTCFDFNSPPNYFMGDGITKYVDNANAVKLTTPNAYYKISSEYSYDLVIANHKPVSERILDLYDAPVINIIHSEVIPNFEDPIIHKNIKKYIAIRPSIKEHLVDHFDIDESMIDVIYNPIDASVFNRKNISDNGYYLFVGTYDYLRKAAIDDFIDLAKSDGKEAWFVGRGYPKFSQSWVKTFPPTSNVVEFTKQCSCVGSVLMGRTAIEGWLCGKSAWVYDIDAKGQVKDKRLYHHYYWDKERSNIKTICKRIIKL